MFSLPRSPLSALVSLVAVVGVLFLFAFSFRIFKEDEMSLEITPGSIADYEANDRFPVGVDPDRKVITEDPIVDWYVTSHLSINIHRSRQKRAMDWLFANLVKSEVFQQLAAPLSRILVIYPGERREEVVKNFGDILKWSATERKEFSDLIINLEPVLVDGKFFPGKYTVPSKSKPAEVATLVSERFTKEILVRYGDEVKEKVSLEEALTIASLLEREAYDFVDMRYISGIIWNRLFVGMPLQLDATLQYAKGSNQSEVKWWPKILPRDKYITSAFNTYENIGLPPSPIANPSVEAVVAALNPRITDCMFYFHDDDGNFYCSVTYDEHVTKLKEVFGQGK